MLNSEYFFDSVVVQRKPMVFAPQPLCWVVWLKLSLTVSETLQSIERVYLKSFIGIGTCNQKLL